MAGEPVLDVLCERFVVDKDHSALLPICTGLREGRLSLLQFVDSLGPYLTHAETNVRLRGTLLLSSVVEHCVSKLNEKEMVVICKFYKDKLKDHYTLLPAVLQGFLCLSVSPLLPEGLAVDILKALFCEVQVQSLIQVDRRSIYSIIANFMDGRRHELKGLGADFVYGFLQAMDGEKDPRNLLVTFHIAYDILRHGFQLGPYDEEFFEVTSCYFPIDFSPPTNDPYGVTHEQLVLALRPVLSYSPQLAQFVLPLLLEKLDSEMQSSKRDAMETLTECCAAYGANELQDSLNDIATSLRREVLEPVSEAVEMAALDAIQALALTLARSVMPPDGRDLLHMLLEDTVVECTPTLTTGEARRLLSASRLLQAVGKACYRACIHVLTASMHVLVKRFNDSKQALERCTLVDALRNLSLCCQDLTEAREGEESPLHNHIETLLELAGAAVSDTHLQLRQAGIALLIALASLPGALSEEQLGLAVCHLSQLIQDPVSQCSVAAVDGCAALASMHSTLLISHCLPPLTAQLLKDAECHLAMKSLARLCLHPDVMRHVVPELLDHLCTATTVADVVVTCEHLHNIVSQSKRCPESLSYLYNTLLLRLLSHAVHTSTAYGEDRVSDDFAGDASVIWHSSTVIGAVARLLTAISSFAEAEYVEVLLPDLLLLFLDGDGKLLANGMLDSPFQPLQPNSPWQQTQLTALLAACIGSLQRKVAVPEWERLLSYLVKLTLTSEHTPTVISGATCIAALVNKEPSGLRLDVLLKDILKKLDDNLSVERQHGCRLHALTLLLWVTKAMVLRYHPTAPEFVNKLLFLLGDTDLGVDAADGFRLLVTESSLLLGPAAHADIRLLYRQRLYTERAACLLLAANADGDRRSNSLQALAHLLAALPRQALVAELPTLSPHLLSWLAEPHVAVLAAALALLQVALAHSPKPLEPQVESFLTCLLPLTRSPSMSVRIAALKCLSAITCLPTHLLLPHWITVQHTLAAVLDDKKRLVRREAIEARGRWFLLGSPGR
uniref:MMS19 nucleotide excision repair protein homolog isoform X2 n=1 Tax=Myxine glutinosa TaxID=7769 RepID=UPI00358FE5AB